MAKKVKNVIKCDNCGRNIVINPRYKKVGDLEYRYFTCRRCKTVYVISVTDGPLREEIKKYEKILEEKKDKNVPPETMQEVQLILKNNVQRSKELKIKYPLKLKVWER